MQAEQAPPDVLLWTGFLLIGGRDSGQGGGTILVDLVRNDIHNWPALVCVTRVVLTLGARCEVGKMRLRLVRGATVVRVRGVYTFVVLGTTRTICD